MTPVIIAEWGQCPQGRIDTAIEMVKATKQAGAQVAKFQLLTPEKIVSESAPIYWGEGGQDHLGNRTQRETFTRAGMIAYRDWRHVKDACDAIGIEFLATPFDFDAVEALETVGVSAYKIASGDLTHHPLLELVAQTEKPIYLSTGAAFPYEIQGALDVIGSRCVVTLLACSLAYPTKPENANLARITSIKRMFSRPVGLSDHTSMPESALAATALGATVLEVHTTLDNNADDVPDHKIACNPRRLTAYVQAARIGATLRGSGHIVPLPHEEPAREGARRSIVAARYLERGRVIEEADLDYLRPGTGISPALRHLVVGQTLAASVQRGEQITQDQLEDST